MQSVFRGPLKFVPRYNTYLTCFYYITVISHVETLTNVMPLEDEFSPDGYLHMLSMS